MILAMLYRVLKGLVALLFIGCVCFIVFSVGYALWELVVLMASNLIWLLLIPAVIAGVALLYGLGFLTERWWDE